MHSFSLEITSGRNTGESFSFHKEQVTIGRNSSNSELILNDQSVSSFHAIIKWVDDNYHLEDNNSTNGTFINGQPLISHIPVPLSDGDEIRLGRVSLVFCQREQTFTMPSVSIQSGMSHTSPMVGKLQGLPKSRFLICGLVIFIVIIAGLGLYKKNTPSKSSTTKSIAKTASSTIFPLPATGSYGQSAKDTSPRHLSFSFTGTTGLTKLILMAKNIDREEISILINGRGLGYMTSTLGGLEEITIKIPSNYILPKQENRLVFKSVAPDSGWLVKNLRLKVLPENICDPNQGKKYFALGKEMYAERTVNKQNLFASIKHFSRAISYSATCTPRPIFYDEARNKYDLAENELNDQYQDILFLSEKLSRMGEQLQAIALLESVNAIIPDNNDPRRKKVKKLLEKQKHSNKL